jgi:hypothetical protein
MLYNDLGFYRGGVLGNDIAAQIPLGTPIWGQFPQTLPQSIGTTTAARPCSAITRPSTT